MEDELLQVTICEEYIVYKVQRWNQTYLYTRVRVPPQHAIVITPLGVHHPQE